MIMVMINGLHLESWIQTRYMNQIKRMLVLKTSAVEIRSRYTTKIYQGFFVNWMCITLTIIYMRKQDKEIMTFVAYKGFLTY